MDLEFFHVNTDQYISGTDYTVVRPASLKNPKDSAVMFITDSYPNLKEVFNQVSGCLVFWPEKWDIPDGLQKKHAVVPCKDPHLSYCKFYQQQGITGLDQPEETEYCQGSHIAKTARIGDNTIVFPGCYIGGQVTIGQNCYIGAGVKITGRVTIGDSVRIRENTVIGADGLSTDRDEDDHPVTMPQFGGILIEDEVQIGANVTICRGAIDDTVLHRACKIDNSVFVSHNVEVGEESFVVGMTLLFGSASVGRQAQISGGCTVGNYVHVGDRSLLGMGAVSNRSIPENTIAYGTPARAVRKRYKEN